MKKNLQISIEMLSVYSIVLLMFTILLASISTQASVAISQQLYFQLLANAQDFASRIQRAYSYGNGYKESFYFPAEVGFIPFNLTITGPGIITASAKYGNKVLSAYAFSGVQSYYLDPYYAIPNGYSIPIAAGIINIVNSNGLICINSQTCPAYKIPKYISIYATNSTASISNNVTIIAKVTDQFGNPIPYPWVGFSTTLGLFSNGKQTQFVQGDGMGIAKVTLKSNNQKGIAKVIATAFNGNLTTVSNLAAWFPLNENQQNITFDVKNNNNGNAYNIAWLSATPISSASFNGVNAYISVPDSASLSPTSAVTVEAWIKSSVGVAGLGVITKGPYSGDYDYMLYLTGSGTAVSFYIKDSTGASDSITTTFKWSDGIWHHYVAVFNGDWLYLYIDGVLKASKDTALTNIRDSTNPLLIGRGWNAFLNGSIANVQIYSTALTPQQIQQLYLQGINSPPIPNAGLIGWWSLQGNAHDYSSYNNNGIIYNAIFVPINVTQVSNLNVSSSPIINQFTVVGKFNGVNSSINCGNSVSLNINGPITISAWVKPSSYRTAGIVSKINGAGVGAYGLWTRDTGSFEIIFDNPNDGWLRAKSPDGILMLNTWNYIVGVWDGQTLKVYHNSNMVGNQSYTGRLGTTTQPLSIGSIQGTLNSFNGSITNVQIYNSSLTPQQIQQLYLQGINSPPIPNAGLVGWWPLQGNANDYSSYGNNGTVYNVNFVRSNYSYLPIYQSSNKSGATFNGVNSYINQPSTSSLSTSALTFSFWSKQIGTQNFYMHPIGVFGDQRATVYVSPNTYGYSYKFYNISGTNYEGYITTLDNNWHFFTATFDGSRLKVYIDGVLKVDRSAPGVINKVDNSLFIGATGTGSSPAGNWFYGFITNVQLYNSSLTSQQIQQLYYAGIPPSNEIRIVLK